MGKESSGICRRIARDIPDGSYVNLGIGLPTGVAEHLSPEKDIILHSENGILGMGGTPECEADYSEGLINAGKKYVTLLAGAAIIDHTLSFAMMRGGHLDYAILGAYQVAANGDLANWHGGDENSVPAVGGAMDLAVGAKNIYVAMRHRTMAGVAKLVKECSYPLTGQRVVDRIYTEFCTLAPAGDRFEALWIADGMSLQDLQDMTDAPLKPVEQVEQSHD